MIYYVKSIKIFDLIVLDYYIRLIDIQLDI